MEKVYNNKIYESANSALKDLLFDGMTIMSGGFGLGGIPENLILALSDSKIKSLIVITKNAGTDRHGLGMHLETKQVEKAMS